MKGWKRRKMRLGAERQWPERKVHPEDARSRAQRSVQGRKGTDAESY